MNTGNRWDSGSSCWPEWDASGFVLARKLIPGALVHRVLDQVVSRVRNDPPLRHPGTSSYASGDHYQIVTESSPGPCTRQPEDSVSRVFNCHAEGACLELAHDAHIVANVVRILGKRLDCFQSQCVFKNPGAIGQPWHQDAYYFDFDLEPKVGVWIALSHADASNGCLWVLPGSHTERVHEHVPDRRPQANAGYVQIAGHEFAAAIPVPMQPGDVLFFDSHLMHKSGDNSSSARRVAMVLHYARPESRCSAKAGSAELQQLTRWISVSI